MNCWKMLWQGNVLGIIDRGGNYVGRVRLHDKRKTKENNRPCYVKIFEGKTHNGRRTLEIEISKFRPNKPAPEVGLILYEYSYPDRVFDYIGREFENSIYREESGSYIILTQGIIVGGDYYSEVITFEGIPKNVVTTDDFDQNSLMHCYAEYGTREQVSSLFKEHPEMLEARNSSGETPIFSAIKRTRMLEYLIELGADVNARNNNDVTPLHHVRFCEDKEEIRNILIKAGAEIDVKDNCQMNPTHWFVCNDSIEMVKWALDKNPGFDINSRDSNGITPLMKVSGRSYGDHDEEIIKFLIEKGADPNLTDNHNMTSLHHAAEWGTEEVVEILIKTGANLEARDENGMTPLEFARLCLEENTFSDCENRLMRVIKTLEKYV